MKAIFRRKSGWALYAAGIALSVAIVTVWFLVRYEPPEDSLGVASLERGQPPAIKSMAHLYFGDMEGRHLVAEPRVMEKSSDPAVFGRHLIEALIQGPRQGASRILPVESRLDAIFISPAGVAYVDFAAGLSTGHPGGIGTELLSVYAVANTLVLNVDGVRTVKILIGGEEAQTLAGHVDLRTPFEADMMWIR